MKHIACVVIATLTSVLAQAQRPIVRAHLEPASGIIVGQPVRLVVEVLVPNYFTDSPEFPEFELENAIVVLPQERAQNVSEHVGGITYAGIVETYTLYPQQPGDFEVPPAQISLTYAAVPPKSTMGTVSLPTLKFRAALPAAAQGMSYFLPTTRLTLQQQWSDPLKNVRVGDTITRTLTVTATKMQAMLIPPLPMEGPAGIRVYQAEPAVQDYKTSRGDFVYGRRVQSAQYLIQKEGDYTLPAIELKWWNLTTKRMATATLPAVHFVAAANPGIVSELPPEVEPVGVVQPERIGFWRRYGKLIETSVAALLGALLLIWLGLRFIPQIVHGVRAWRVVAVHSEPHLFQRLLRTCRGHDAAAAYRQLLQWIALWRPGLSLRDFIAEAQNPALTDEVENLGKAIYSGGGQTAPWKGSGLAEQLKRVRNEKSRADSADKSLPVMNPVR